MSDRRRPVRRARRAARACLAVAAALALHACGGAQRAGGEAPVAVAPTRTYPVRFERPSHVGQRARLVAEGTKRERSVTKLGAQLVEARARTTHVRMVAVYEVLEVDARGDDVRGAYAIEAFEAAEGDGPLTPRLRRGQRVEVVPAEREEQTVVTVDGAPAPEDLRRFLDVVVSMTESHTDDDDVFGTDRPQPVGARWPIDGEAARRDLARIGVVVPEGALHGEGQLAGVERCGASECVELRVELRMERLVPPNLPPEARVDRAEATARMRGLFPVDPSAPPHYSEASTDIVLVARIPAPDGTVLRVETSTSDAHRTTVTPL